MNYIEEKKDSKIITVYPASGGNGANYIATNLAYALRERDPYTRIAIVDFDFANPHLGLSLTNDDIHGIDNLVDKINGDFLDKELFKENMIKLKDNIDLLRGTQLGQFNLVKQSHLRTITEFLKETYDVVFIATSSETTDPGTAVGLYVADHTLVVSRYNAANAIHATKTFDAIRTYGGQGDVGVIYNFYHNQNGLDFSDVYKDWPVFGTIPYLPDTVDNNNLSGNALVSVKKKKNPAQAVYEEVLKAFTE